MRCGSTVRSAVLPLSPGERSSHAEVRSRHHCQPTAKYRVNVSKSAAVWWFSALSSPTACRFGRYSRGESRHPVHIWRICPAVSRSWQRFQQPTPTHWSSVSVHPQSLISLNFGPFTTTLRKKSQFGTEYEIAATPYTVNVACSFFTCAGHSFAESWLRTHVTGYIAVQPGWSIRNCWMGVVSAYVFSTRGSPSAGSLSAANTWWPTAWVIVTQIASLGSHAAIVS